LPQEDVMLSPRMTMESGVTRTPWMLEYR
jgi:hypothetical protein